MQTQKLETTVRTLKSLRDKHHSQLDISAVTELNAVIADLEEMKDQEQSERRQKACLRALYTMAGIIRLVSNIKDLM